MAPEQEPSNNTEPNPAYIAVLKLLSNNPIGTPIYTDEEVLTILYDLGFTKPIAPVIPKQYPAPIVPLKK
jgi:hypothetical protein